MPHLVSGAHVGLRYYRLSAAPAHGNKLQRLLAPQHIGAGAFFLGATDHALVSPFENGRRVGGFFDWGTARLAVAGGDEWRAVIGIGKQILPYLF